MTSKKVLLGTTALLSAGVLMATDQAVASDLEVTINGFTRYDMAGGDLDSLQDGVENRRSFDQQMDTEVHVNVRAIDEETGIEYGGRVEFEADTSSTNNTDEAWIFVRGGWGEFRFGDEDGAADNMRLGGQSIAAGTGGIDGADSVIAIPNQAPNSGDATKIVYYSPNLSGFQLGVSYAHDSDGGKTFSTTDRDSQSKWLEGGITYDGSFGGVDLRLAVTGIANDGNGNEDGVRTATEDYWGANYGGILSVWGIDFAAGGYTANDAATQPGGDNFNGWTAGVATALGPTNVSLTGGQAYGLDGNDPWSAVVSADIGLLPGLALQGDLNYFDRDADNNDSGVTGVVRVALSY